MRRSPSGVTLMEVLIAMLILGLITGGIFSAFVFSRGVSGRSEGQTMVRNYIQRCNEQLRQAVGGPAAGWTLDPGIYVDQKMANDGPFAGQTPSFHKPVVIVGGVEVPVIPLAVLNFPPEMAKFQKVPGPASSTLNQHGDGTVLIVEGLVDLDGDGKVGQDFDHDGTVDLKRVTIHVQWSP